MTDSPASILYDNLGNPVGIFADGITHRLQTESIVTKIIPTISHLNSTTALLASNGVFNGVGEDVSSFVSIDISIITDQAGATDGLIFEFSQDNILFDYVESFTLAPNVGQFFSLAPRAKFFRIKYTNGTTPQSNFALSTVYYPIGRSVYSQNIDTDILGQKAVETVRSVLAAQKSGSEPFTYINLQTANSNPAGTEQGLIVRNIPYGTQTISGSISANAGAGNFNVIQGMAANLNATVVGTVTSNQGTPIAAASSWPVKISDGVDTVGISTVAGAKALKVDVVQTTGSAGSGGTSSNYTASFPSAGTAAGFSDGSNMQGATVFDADSGAGTQYVLGVNLRQSSSGGSIEVGTLTHPIRTDPTGVTTQPISGTVITNVARPSTNTTTSVASSLTDIVLLASNSARLGATFFNDSSSMLLIKLGGVTTLTDFTIKLFPQSYYEVPFGFTGNINGFWISAVGSARIGELQ